MLNLSALVNNLDDDGIAPLADYPQLVQIGADTQVQIDADGLAGSSGFSSLVRLKDE